MERKYVIICGMSRTGTTLPLTLLDSHPDLIVFSEELRFHEMGIHNKPANKAIDTFFNNGNIKKFAFKKREYNKYLEHGGTGFGVRDYSDFDYKGFEEKIKTLIKDNQSAKERLDIILESFKHNSKYKESKSNAYVCKAPHNELYIRQWADMLGDNGKYLLCTRNPLEQFASFKRIAKMRGLPPTCPHWFVKAVRKRYNMWKFFPENRTYIINYHKITTQPEQEMRNIAGFLDIPYNDILLKPTKYGTPWKGNSSRGSVSAKVHANKNDVRKELTEKEISIIESSLKELLR
jgi:hypothetical protein